MFFNHIPKEDPIQGLLPSNVMCSLVWGRSLSLVLSLVVHMVRALLMAMSNSIGHGQVGQSY